MKLQKKKNAIRPEGPIVLAIMDGVGIGAGGPGDMVAAASTPCLDALVKSCPHTQLKAHGMAVGMPSDGDMGNSEVGHNAIGAGQVYAQGAKLVAEAVESGVLFEGDTWKELTKRVIDRESTLHFLGLLSDGNVHSHVHHLHAMLRRAKAAGVQRARVHVLLDGRDVDPTSADRYVADLEKLLTKLNEGNEADYAIASGGGRLYITMDRYEADWPMIERGWAVHVEGEGRAFASAGEAIETLRAENPEVIDQDLGSFVIHREGTPVGPIADGDSVILFNFRGDRAIEISRAFDEPDLDTISRDAAPDVLFAGMMEYDADLHIPRRFLVTPPSISNTLGEYLAAEGLRTLAISETQKFGHVTYFFNGNKSGKFDETLETYVEIPSDNVSFDERPWMKAAEITDVVLDGIEKGAYDFIRINYPNGDMVGHTGNLLAVEISVEATDLSIARLVKAVKKANGLLLITADHGNADEMFELDRKTGKARLDKNGNPKMKTSHTLNPVPFILVDPSGRISCELKEGLGISSIAATILELFGYEPPGVYDPSLLKNNKES